MGFALVDAERKALMDFVAIYQFLFESFAGIGCLVAIGLVLSVLACVIMERKTRKRFKNHQPKEDDWSFFDDDDEDDESDAEKNDDKNVDKKEST